MPSLPPAARAAATAAARRNLLNRQQPPRRLYSSSSPPAGPERPNFYKTFSRPIFKVALMAIFTYQLAYYGWTKLETDEVKADADGTS